MGRVTYQMMAQYFPAADGAIAAVMNRSPKAVFSRTLRVADWPGSVILSGDTAAEIDALRRQGTGEILAQGGGSFAKSLVSLDVPDVYSLTVYPYLAGDGPRLFTSTQARELELISRTDFANGVLALEYRRRR